MLPQWGPAVIVSGATELTKITDGPPFGQAPSSDVLVPAHPARIGENAVRHGDGGLAWASWSRCSRPSRAT